MRSRKMIKGGGSSSDLMVCFPSRTHSSSTPDSQHRRQNALNHRRSLTKRTGASPLTKSNQVNAKKSDVPPQEEPTSPKVTCAGKIKVRQSKRGGGVSGGEEGKNWESLMDEIEKIRSSKSENIFFGIKKDLIGFLTCLRLGFRCFGTFPPVNFISKDKEERSSKTVFSKWFMILHENQNNEKRVSKNRDLNAEEAVPPPNALLLMRCRSTAGKEKDEEIENKDLGVLLEEEKNTNFVVMSYDTKYYRLSSDIAKETWVVGGIQDHISTRRSSKKLLNKN